MIRVNDNDYPVTPAFKAQIAGHADLLVSDYGAMESEKARLLDLSNRRASFRDPLPAEPLALNGTLTVAEHERLEAIVHVMNVHHAVNFLGVRHHGEFGFDGVDQIHGNQWRDECGCIAHTVHDHHKRGTEHAVAMPHRVVRACDAHAHLAHDPKAHFDHLSAKRAEKAAV